MRLLKKCHSEALAEESRNEILRSAQDDRIAEFTLSEANVFRMTEGICQQSQGVNKVYD